MGCGASNAVQVQPVTQTPRAGSNKDAVKKPRSAGTRSLNNKVGILNEENNNKNKSSRSSSRTSLRSRTGSRASLSDTSDRGGSAVSKESKHSCDSGLGEDYAHIITEDSDESKIREIEGSFQPADDLDLAVTGTQVSRRLSAKDKERMSEQRVLQSLREEGLISRPKTRASGGISFEVVMDVPDENALVRPPPRLAKLERRKKKKKALTEDEIKAKLEKAELRRKQKEKERMDKIERVTNKSNINQALDTFEKQQQTKETVVTEKMSAVEENRERKLKELREKLRAKEEHAEKVRRRKKLLPIVPHPDSSVANEITELKA